MNPAILLAATLLLTPAPAQIGAPIPHAPLRNTFLVSAETVIDNATAIDPTAPDTQFDPQMHQLKQSRDTLKDMASEDGEQEIVTESSNIIFAISACHIQARAASKTDTCKAQIAASITAMMRLLNHHKSAGVWIAGPPA
jgi:hypothetical protein